jgi:galactitol-specific phosphotransferase system IIC component
MQSFIVLGIIPGTNFQTTLNFWLTVAAILVVFSMRKHIILARRQVQRALIARRIAHAIDSCEMQPAAA